MVLIAIDKHSRKILGYLCKNGKDVAYCCSECDVEFTTAKDLVKHIVIHENSLDCITLEAKPNDTDGSNDIPPSLLSDFERDKHLKMKYQVRNKQQFHSDLTYNIINVLHTIQVTPCTVQLFRFDHDDEEKNLDAPMAVEKNGVNQENIAPLQEEPTRKRPLSESLTSRSTIQASLTTAKKQKTAVKNVKNVMKRKPPPATAVCFLCGEKFDSYFALQQHQKSHLENSVNKPVFPCKVCGKNVKNMKMHLHKHTIESKKTKTVAAKVNKNVEMVKSIVVNRTVMVVPNDTKVEEASSSTDAVFTKTLVDKDIENGVTSNEALTELQSTTTTHTSLCIGPFMILPPSRETQYPRGLLPNNEPPVVEEFPLNYDEFPINCEIGENIPTQSTQQATAYAIVGANVTHQNEIDDARNGEVDNMTFVHNVVETLNCNICAKCFPSQLKLDKHKALHDRKVPCEVCGKLVGLSYKRIHVRKYHTSDNVDIVIPSESQ